MAEGFKIKLSSFIPKKTRRFISIDFGQAFLKIAYFDSKGKVAYLLGYDITGISSGEDNKAKAINFITGFLQKNSILEREACLTVSDPESIFIKILTLPAIPKEEVLEAAKWQLKEDFPFDIDTAIADWQIIKEYSETEGAKKIDIICILAKPEFIDKYLAIMDNCNLSPVRISSPFMNYAYILSCLQPNPQVSAVLDIGYNLATLCIYQDNRPHFIRNLTFSSERISQSLTGVLVSDKGRVELSLEQAEEIKRAFGIPQNESGILKDNIQAIHVISLMRPFLEGLVRELTLSFNYFTSNFKVESPSLLYITGGGANLKNLDSYLNKELNLRVSKLPLPDCIGIQAIDKERLNTDQNQIACAAGAILAGLHAINLLPLKIKAKKIEFIQKVFLRTFAIISGIIFVFSLFILNFQMRDYKKRLTNAQVHLQSIQQLKVLKQRIDLRENLVNRLQKDSVPASGMLKEISNIMPDNIVLNELVLDQQRHVLILKGEVSARGSAVESLLTNFMGKIEASSFFREASLVISNDMEGAQVFEIKCDLVN